MRGKLSQPAVVLGADEGRLAPRTAQRGRDARTSWLRASRWLGCWAPGGLCALAVILAVGGCNRVDAGEAPLPIDEAPDRAASANPEPSAPAEIADFRWPEDPSHPILALDIEGPFGQGRIEIELMPELAPETVAHVLRRASKGFYDGTTFHRVIPGFMIQGGDPKSRDRDPTNDGRGGMKVTVADEFSAAPFARGVVAMANRGRPNSSGSQFFIMHGDDPTLEGRYTVIGRVRSGMDVVDAISGVARDEHGRWGPRDRPIENVVMARVRATSALPDEG